MLKLHFSQQISQEGEFAIPNDKKGPEKCARSYKLSSSIDINELKRIAVPKFIIEF
jgi:hypothetical protein